MGLLKNSSSSKIFDFISEVGTNQFPTFKELKTSVLLMQFTYMVDLIWVDTQKLKTLHGSLFLHGNVFDGSKLGPYHNTVPMLERELLKIEEI